MLPKTCDSSNARAHALHVPTTFLIRNYYFNGKLHNYPQLNLQLTKKTRLKDQSTPDNNELNVLHPKVHV